MSRCESCNVRCTQKEGEKEGRTEHSFSGSLSSAAPIPPDKLNDFGHPQLSPTPATSCWMTFMAWTASSGEALPSWKMRRDFSSGWQSKMERPFFRNETTPVRAAIACLDKQGFMSLASESC